MARFAIFVDAGYLFAKGSTAITGMARSRAGLRLDVAGVVAALKSTATTIVGDTPLLHVYWYGGARGVTMSGDHAMIGIHPYVYLRLGTINSAEDQKGVDALIVTDMIEPARNHAVEDIILMSGDDDLRVGVTISQSFGVCVHLLGIMGPRGASQSPLLRQEADTGHVWPPQMIRSFLTAEVMAEPVALTPLMAPLLDAVATLIANLTERERSDMHAHAKAGRPGLPMSMDRRALVVCRTAVARDLDDEERRTMRAHIRHLIQDQTQDPDGTPTP